MEIIPAAPEHEDQILALGGRALGWGDDPRFADLYRWKHQQNPFGRSPGWVAVEDGRVAGFRVFLRWRFRRADGTTVDAVRAVDTATDPEFQGRGIFRALTTGAIAELTRDGVGFVFNTPNDQSRPGYLKMGWIELGRPPVAVAPRLRSLPRIARSRTAAEHWSEPTTAGTPAVRYLDAVRNLDGLLGDEDRRAGDRWHTDRSPAYLRWRYGLDHLAYRMLDTGDLAGGDRLARGLAVFRTRRRGDALEATVAEVLAPDARSRNRLVQGVLRATGADYVLVAETGAAGTRTAVSLPAFSPLVTWRALAVTAEPAVTDFDFAVGDLELF